MTKLLIDSNILVYSIDEESTFYPKARKILTSSMYHKVTTSKNLVEFLSVVTRPIGYDILPNIALDILEEIIHGIEILYPNEESLAILWHLIKKYQTKGLRIHDVEIASIGLASGIFEIATFNKKDFIDIKEVTVIEL